MKKVILLALLFMFALSGISMANPGFRGRGSGPGKGSIGIASGKWWKMPQVTDKLALTKEEKEKLDAVYLEHRHKMIDLHSQVEKERLELEQLLDSSSFNGAACLDRFKKFQEAQTNLAIERFEFLVQVRELLGLERFQKLKAVVSHHRVGRKHER